jgi:phospholipid N-methyltransferase
MPKHNPFIFFKRFLASPIAVGAILPTSLQTARIMASPIDPKGTVLEMGAGTGSITQGILERIENASQLTSVEIDPELALEFKKNFPNVKLEVGDAEETLAKGPAYDAIISGVPFSVMNPEKRERMFALIKEKLKPGGVFVAIQYSLSSKKKLERNFRSVKIKFSPLNAPPAFLYVCREPILSVKVEEHAREAVPA